MSDATRPALRELLDTAAAEPPRTLDAQMLVQRGRRRAGRVRAAVGACAAAALVLPAAAVVWAGGTETTLPGPDATAGPAQPAPTPTGLGVTYEPSVVDNTTRGRPDPDAPVDLLATGQVMGAEVRLVGFRTTDGRACIGWAKERLGLPNLCTPAGGPVDSAAAYATEATITSSAGAVRVVWGWGPAGTATVELLHDGSAVARGTAAGSGEKYGGRGYYILQVPPTDRPLTVRTKDAGGTVTSTRSSDGT